MVRSIISTIVTLTIFIAFFIFTDVYVNTQFSDFESAVETLYEKVEQKTATRQDGYAVKSLWHDKKDKLHVFIPHGDIAPIENYLDEACILIYTNNYQLALSKLEVVKELAKQIPKGYTLAIENII